MRILEGGDVGYKFQWREKNFEQKLQFRYHYDQDQYGIGGDKTLEEGGDCAIKDAGDCSVCWVKKVRRASNCAVVEKREENCWGRRTRAGMDSADKHSNGWQMLNHSHSGDTCVLLVLLALVVRLQCR